MNKIIKILIIVLASAWAFPMSGAKAVKGTTSMAEWTRSYADVDVVEKAVSIFAYAISKGEVVQAEATAAGANTGNHGNPVPVSQKKKTASALWYLALLWLIVLTAGMAYIFYRFGNRIENHRRNLQKFMDDQAWATATVNSNENMLSGRLNELESIIASLQSENERLRNHVGHLDAAVKDLAYGSLGIANSAQPKRTAVAPMPSKAPASEEDVFYVDTLNIGGDGTLSIPLQILKEQNSGELFMVTGNFRDQNGTATYTINPKAANLMGQVSKLQKFCDGLAAVRGNHITVESPGTLSREGYDLKVVRKLIVKSE